MKVSGNGVHKRRAERGKEERRSTLALKANEASLGVEGLVEGVDRRADDGLLTGAARRAEALK